MSHFMREAIGWVTIALLIGTLVFFAPMRSRRTIVTRRIVPVSAPTAWEYVANEPIPGLISQQADPADPLVTNLTLRVGWPGKRIVTARLRTLASEPPTRLVQRFDDINGRPMPYGVDGIFTQDLEPVTGGTRITLGFDGELHQSLQVLILRRHQRKFLAKMAKSLQGES